MMSENEQESEKCKTIADILAEYRNDADAMDSGELYQPTAEYLRRLLDRLEAAWKREKAEIEADALAVGGVVEAARHKPVGNAAAMREALVRIVNWFDEGGWNEDAEEEMDSMLEAANTALAKPPRNCDVGTAEEQGERCMAQFDQWRRKGDGKKLITAIMAWAQMPYEAEEGGAK